MKTITMDKLFDLLDDWRNLPSYQLERRADIFFALFLQRVIESRFDVVLKDSYMVPEFPIKHTVKSNNLSDKVDYALLSEDGKKVFLVELKTDNSSIRSKQMEYLKQAKNSGFSELLSGIKELFLASDQKRKYYHLISKLGSMSLIEAPDELEVIMNRQRVQGASTLAKDIRIIDHVESIEVVYIMPRPIKPTRTQLNQIQRIEDFGTIIYFDQFADQVIKNQSPLAVRFAQSLRQWQNVQAGNTLPKT